MFVSKIRSVLLLFGHSATFCVGNDGPGVEYELIGKGEHWIVRLNLVIEKCRIIRGDPSIVHCLT